VPQACFRIRLMFTQQPCAFKPVHFHLPWQN
jgi:hypothetical protein